MMLTILTSGIPIALSQEAQTSVSAYLFRERFARTDSDSVAYGTSLDGAYRWSTEIDSDSHTYPVISTPETYITTEHDPSQFYFEPTPDYVTTGPPYQIHWSFPQIDSYGYGAETYTESDLPVTFSPGFDSDRTVSPLLLSSSQAIQTVTVHVTLHEAYPRMQVTVSADSSPLTDGMLVGSPTLIPEPEVPCDSDMGTEYFTWICRNNALAVGTEYTFTAGFAVNNNVYPAIVEYKPRVVVRGQLRLSDEYDKAQGSSLTVTDNLLGDITYSATGDYSWNYFARDRWTVIYRPFALQLPEVDDPAMDLRVAAGGAAPSSLYASYLDIRYAEVQLVDGNCVFTMRLEGTAPPNTVVGGPVKFVRYVWRIYDGGGNLILRVYVDWTPSGGWVAAYDGATIGFSNPDLHTLQVTLPISDVPLDAASWDARAWNSRNPMQSNASSSAQGPPAFLIDTTVSVPFPTLV